MTDLTRRVLLITPALLLIPRALKAAGTARIEEAGEGGSLIRNGESQPLTTGQQVIEGDTVLTGPNGLALLILPDETRINIGADSAVLAKSLGTAPALHITGLAGVTQQTGSAGELLIETPLATIAQRGGRSFIGTAGARPGVLVQTGSALVQNETGSRVLQPGQGVDLVVDEPLGEVSAWGEARVAEAWKSVGLTP